MEIQPLVSVGAVNYNNEKYVIETLESIKAQTYINLELIIVDDCSTDNSLHLIKEWLPSFDRPYKLIQHHQNLGIAATCNDVFNHATGKYVSIIATDDVMMPNKTLHQVKVMQDDDELGMVYGDSKAIDEEGKEITKSMFEHYKGKSYQPSSGYIFKEIVNGFYFYSQTCLFKLDKLKEIQFQFDNRFISEDWDVQLAVARNFKIFGSPEIFVAYRKSTTSFTAINWTNERKHKILMSHFNMFNKYYAHPLNNWEDKKIISLKLKELYWNLYNLKKFSYTKRISYYKFILHKDRSVKNILVYLSILLGVNKPIMRILNK